jgi:hypothetical protein
MKLQFRDVWATPDVVAQAGQVLDVHNEDLVKQLIEGRHAEPYVPAALAEGARPDAFTEIRIHQLEAQLADVINAIRAVGGDLSKVVAATVEPAIAGDAPGPFSNP